MALTRTFFVYLLALGTLFFISACAPKNPLPEVSSTASSKLFVPFVAPRSELCASSSIEMLALYWESKNSFTPALDLHELDARTLIPAKGGTLQIELSAAARADGLVVYPLQGGFEALIAELSADHPVVALLNRGFSWYPLWHYAPIVGYETQTQQIMTHYADTPDEMLSLHTFLSMWERADRWGVILLPPYELPVSLAKEQVLRSIYDFESTGKREEAIVSYKTAHLRWPYDTNILFALANAYYKTQRLDEAEKTYRLILALDAKNPLASNNLADLLTSQSRLEEALEIIEKTSSDDINIQKILNATRKEILFLLGLRKQ